MQKRFLFITIIVLSSFYFINSGCSKLDTTDIGSDLLPAVDNINTFEKILDINTTQGIFNPDTSVVTNTEDHVLGKINNDPLFGTTTANIYAQFKPTFFPYYYGNANDTIIGFDSVVLCLSYKGCWGDSVISPIKFDVRQVPKNAGGLWDSLYQSRPVNYTPPTTNLLGSANIDLTTVSNYVRYNTTRKDSVRNLIRIKLTNTAFLSAFFSRDSLPAGNNTFRTDSSFRDFLNGLAIMATGSGNCLMYTNLTDSLSRLEVFYRKKNGGIADTVFSSFKMIPVNGVTTINSVTVNNIIRNRAGASISSPGTDAVYIQTSPGSYVNLKIPSLDTLSNRIVHRAEIIMEQIPNNSMQDSLFSVPDFLYIDLIDTGSLKWKPIYYDLSPSTAYNPDNPFFFFPGSSGIDYFYHGGYPRYKADVFGTQIKFYNFNITRYVQEIVTKRTTNYTMRLFAPYKFKYPQYTPSSLSGNNRIATGRVKLGSGTNANYRMRLRIIYSKI